MTEKLKKHRQFWLVLPIVICIGIIVFGGINYLSNLRDNLTEQAIENVVAVTHQQQQSFDNFIAADRERLRSHAEYFSQHTYNGPDAIDELLGLFSDVKAVYAVACLDEGWLATSADYDYKYLDDATLATYRAFEDSGVRSSYISIFSQKAMLRDFAEKNGLLDYEYYVDDGYTGRNFNRPSFQRMIADIEAGKVRCVITKDLSRLGRNYIEAGSYMEVFFPRHNVRYIAIIDGVDSLNRQEMDITPFKNILNDLYSRDISKKV